jgi:glutathione S-transferase
MELHIFGPADGDVLASPDAPCLATMIYAKLCGFPVKVVAGHTAVLRGKGQLPVLMKEGRELAASHGEVIAHMRQSRYNTEHSLTRVQMADALALITLVERDLLPALQYAAWHEGEQFKAHTYRWHSRHLYFPLTVMVARCMRRRTDEARMGLSPQVLYERAVRCLSLLDARIAASPQFLFGEFPSEADALVAAAVAVCRTSVQQLRAAAESLPALATFTDRVLSAAFPSIPTERAPLPRNTSVSVDGNILFLGFAGAALLTFALATGLPSRIAG